MKKLIILSIAILSFSSVFSQQNRDKGRWSDRNQSKNTWSMNNQENNNSYSANHFSQQQDRHIDDRDRRIEIDRVNHEYDQRINNYRNDRSINSYERERRIRQAEYERTQKVNSFGKGVVVGALATLILGSLLSH